MILLNPMRKLVTKGAIGASLRADFDEALRMVPLRGISGDAKRAASMTFCASPLPTHPTDWPESPTRQSRARDGLLFTPLLRQKATTRPSQGHADQRIIRRISLQSEPSLTGD